MRADVPLPRPLLAAALGLAAAWLLAIAWTWQHLEAPRGDVAPVAVAVNEQQHELAALAADLSTIREGVAQLEDQRDALLLRIATLESTATDSRSVALAAATPSVTASPAPTPTPSPSPSATPTPSATPEAAPTTVAAAVLVGPSTVAAGAPTNTPPDAFSSNALPPPVREPEPLGRRIGTEEYPIDTSGVDLYDCRDFLDWKQAKFIYEVNLPGDANRLDPDGDGFPCEELPYAGDASRPAVTLSPVATPTPTLAPTPAATPSATSTAASQ